MLPVDLQQPAAIALFLSGVLACFAGYRLFRIVLGIYGFVLGAMIASSTMSASSTASMLIAAIVGGLLGSVVLVFAWFVGVSLVGAGMAVAVAYLLWARIGTGDPPGWTIIVVAIAGAVGAMFIQRYVIVAGTALAGAWTIVLAGNTLLAAQVVEQRSGASTDVWIFYPTTMPSKWAGIAWLVLGVTGTIVQLSTSGPGKRR
ncbi:MAG: DUF4203 domain-containing protein [Vicinamibacterales bacterium]